MCARNATPGTVSIYSQGRDLRSSGRQHEIKSARRFLGFDYNQAVSTFWHDRVEDFETLSLREFAERHKVPVHTVAERRMKLVGRKARPLN
jgi:hypothetical protein